MVISQSIMSYLISETQTLEESIILAGNSFIDASTTSNMNKLNYKYNILKSILPKDFFQNAVPSLIFAIQCF